MKRRQLVKLGVAGLTAVGLGGAGWQFRPTKTPEFIRQELQPPNTRPSLLIVYSSSMGATGILASYLADFARLSGFSVQIAMAADAVDPEPFNAVILGSSIRSSAWLDDIISYARQFHERIAGKPNALFECSMTCAGYRIKGEQLDLQQRANLRSHMNSLLEAAPKLAKSPHDFFSGRLDFDYLTPGFRFAYPFFAGSFLSGDFLSKAEVQAFWTSLTARNEFKALI